MDDSAPEIDGGGLVAFVPSASGFEGTYCPV
jgi:hypothetical protein